MNSSILTDRSLLKRERICFLGIFSFTANTSTTNRSKFCQNLLRKHLQKHDPEDHFIDFLTDQQLRKNMTIFGDHHYHSFKRPLSSGPTRNVLSYGRHVQSKMADQAANEQWNFFCPLCCSR